MPHALSKALFQNQKSPSVHEVNDAWHPVVSAAASNCWDSPCVQGCYKTADAVVDVADAPVDRHTRLVAACLGAARGVAVFASLGHGLMLV